jgi:hypothetical protein
VRDVEDARRAPDGQVLLADPAVLAPASPSPRTARAWLPPRRAARRAACGAGCRIRWPWAAHDGTSGPGGRPVRAGRTAAARGASAGGPGA